ncbi:ATP-binding cassette domain-containing protein [Vibrio sp. S4M6]|uniref:ATP-binding cassette domain-containing protein n=1 Tax=Vibrio sinus TaxID=2946865 RepID=UPI00202AA7BE|nr:ATP-binding cassette domain-containing protein [Vibrio sinus]MCL9780220.1 ATP-binding cassette domain-containing protein [Vibrio sinus]
MPVLHATNISYQFEDGETLFHNLSFTMVKQRVALVGRNGAGKSILASVISGEKKPSTGAITLPDSHAVYHQQPSELMSSELSVARFLGKHHVLKAIQMIESGHCSQHWFDIVGNEWDLPERLRNQLTNLGLPSDPYMPCSQLSGGQLARLRLYQIFQNEVELVILDEPSNHLDASGKQWLIESMQSFPRSVLLISHDRELLYQMEEIWELSSLGLRVYGGNYDTYTEQKRTESESVERQLNQVNKQAKWLNLQAQRNREKADKRAAKGRKLNKEGSQSKLLLNSKKDKATSRVSSRNKSEKSRQTTLQHTELALNARKEHIAKQYLCFSNHSIRSRKVISVCEGVLPFGNAKPITFQCHSNEKLHLTGNNGSGKSTLLQVITGKACLKQGTLLVNTPLYFLDQHFTAIRPKLSILENVILQCDKAAEMNARTLLSGIGFTRERVFQLGNTLSGGEKMKLAMLIASQQATLPLLLLDEPDNHLDLDSKLTLANALKKYRGGFILVSHDKDFAEETGITRQIKL